MSISPRETRVYLPRESDGKALVTDKTYAAVGELGVGAVTANMLTLSTGIAAMIFGLGLTVMLLGGGLVWIGSSKEDDKTVAVESSKPEPATT